MWKRCRIGLIAIADLIFYCSHSICTVFCLLCGGPAACICVCMLLRFIFCYRISHIAANAKQQERYAAMDDAEDETEAKAKANRMKKKKEEKKNQKQTQQMQCTIESLDDCTIGRQRQAHFNIKLYNSVTFYLYYWLWMHAYVKKFQRDMYNTFELSAWASSSLFLSPAIAAFAIVPRRWLAGPPESKCPRAATLHIWLGWWLAHRVDVVGIAASVCVLWNYCIMIFMIQINF